MKQARYGMWAKRDYSSLMNGFHEARVPSSHDEWSWEEQAFAKDAVGPLGGCVWPPRSYSCSFCRREFRSAQALSGHMNVHQRDRARLKQSPTEQIIEIAHHDQDHHDPTPVQINPFPSFLGSFSPPGLEILDPPLARNTKVAEKITKRDLESGSSRSKKSSDLSVSLNLVVRCARRSDSACSDEDEAMIGCKRRRVMEEKPSSKETTLPFFIKSEGFEVLRRPSSIEELDLELRLGERPKVIIKVD